jgi:hypothetical protein
MELDNLKKENKKFRKFLEEEGYDIDEILGKKPSKTLTGAELRIAAYKKLKVRYVEQYYNPQDRHMNSNCDCVMTECGNNTKEEHTYYIDNSTITLEDFEDDADVIGEFPEGTFEVRRAKGVKYE